MDQPKLERLLRLMKMLTANNSYTVTELAGKLDMSIRTVYRYIDTFREAGFVVKKKNECIALDKSSPYFRDISELIHFTEEEAYILKSAIESIDENNLLKQNLKKKLYTVYNYKILADTVVSGKNARNVQLLSEAMEQKHQTVLKNYSSAHGNDIRDRLVEPFAFTTNYVQVWCFCPVENKNKLFKVSRIQSVEILSEKWINESYHQTGFIDIFRMNSEEVYPVKLKLGLRAASLLEEEYPLAGKYLQKISDNAWILETDVCTFEGVGRFIMGLPDEIEIISPEELKSFVREKQKNNFFVKS
jgi:predicted DNA-binding transcriptional regulator YafY